jgi:hypothetical protein
MALRVTKKEPAAAEAKWVEFDSETKVLLIGTDNTEYQVALERMRRRIQRNDARFEEGQVGVVAGEQTEHQNHAMLLGHFIVKDWMGVLDEEGNPVKYTPEVAAQLLEANLDFFVFAIQGGARVAAEAKEELDQTVGKPSPASSGKGSGQAKPTKGVRSTSASA